MSTNPDIPMNSCPLGFTEDDLEKIFFFAPEGKREDFDKWMRGQTVSICTGVVYDHDEKKYKPSACAASPHGTVVYIEDFAQYVDGLPPLD